MSCGKIIGHGESCVEGHECVTCTEIKRLKDEMTLDRNAVCAFAKENKQLKNRIKLLEKQVKAEQLVNKMLGQDCDNKARELSRLTTS